MLISDTRLFAEYIPTINKQNYLLMECESLYASDYSIDTEFGKVKAAAECLFGGYYANEPSTELWNHFGDAI